MDSLTLRGWRDEDAPALVEIFRDPAMDRWISAKLTGTEDALEWVAAQRDGTASGDRYSFAVTDADELTGCVVLKHRREVGYWTAAQARGRGVASGAVEALTTWAFSTLGLTELELRHQVDNEASCRVAHKTGSRFVATLPPEPPWPLAGHLHVRTSVVPGDQRA